MAPDKLQINDPRVEHQTAKVNGKNYHYIVGNPPSGRPIDTLLLVHGWPDLGHGWRYQVPLLLSLNYRVIVPDMLGYGKTDAPEALADYALKSIAADMAALVAHAIGEGKQVILGGHDWGGMVVWMTSLWQPQLVKAVFSICTPYSPPSPQYLADEEFIRVIPNFAYQLQLAGPVAEASIVGKARLRAFLNGMYLGRGPNKERVFDVTSGVQVDHLDLPIGQSPLPTKEEIDFYVDEYDRHGMRFPLNWYRTRRINWEDAQELLNAGRTRIAAPALMVVATNDAALQPWMSENMERHFNSLRKRTVDSHHWALWAATDEVNEHIKEFLGAVYEDQSATANL